MSVLFADITGFTALTERIGAERAYPIVAACLELLDEVAKQHGGTVDHYLGDCVLALFGVPDALEDAPRSAINAAIEMRRRVRDFDRDYALDPPLDVHSGIATGIGIAGDISGPLIREFAVMGDHVDRAYTLTDLASAGEILVDVETRRQVESVFELEARPPVEAPGGRRIEPVLVRSNRVRLHRAELGAERRVFSKLVGRSAELEQMRKRVDALARGEGGVISLLAEAGLGKSRLVAELRSSPEAREVLWLEGRSISNGRNRSFHPFSDLCRSWAGIGDEDDEAQAIERIGRAVLDIMSADEAEELLPFLKTLLGLPTSPAERERLEILQGDMLERLVRRASVRLVTRMSESRPLVMVLDDLHWADLSSIELFEGLLPLARDGRVLFLDVFRPGFTDTSDRILSRVRAELSDRHAEISLRPLDGAAARELVRNVFGAGDVPHATRRMIEEKAQGNPFYIEEVVRALLDAGAVEWRGDALHATQSLDAFEIPSRIQDVIMARVDRLDLGRRRVLQIASVIGGSFHASILEALCPSDQALDDALDALLASEFIVPDDRGPGAEFAFKHPLIQEVTYGGLLEKNRRDLHLRVGEAIETHLSADAPGIESMLAYHFTLGRDAGRAEVHLFRAGEEAARSAASGEALHFFREASRLYLDTHGEHADPAKRALLARNIARALFHRGQLIEAEQSFNDAIRLLGQPVPRTQGALAVRLAARLLPMGARLYLGDRLPRRPPAGEEDREVVALMLERGMCEITANPTRFVLDSLDTLATALRVDPATLPTATRVLAGASMIFAYSGISFGLSRRLLDMARERVREADLQGAVMYGVTSFIHHVFEGDWSDRHVLDEELLRQAIDHGLVWDALTYLGFHAERFIGRGEFESARQRIGVVRELWERFGHDLGRSTFHALSAYLALEEGRYEDAMAATQTYYDENPEPLLHLLALGGKSRAQVRLGRLDAAEATLRRCDTIIGELGRSQVPPYQRSFVLRAQAALDVARLEEALADRGAGSVRARRRRARRTLRSARGVANLCALRRVEIWRLWGTLAWLEGSPKRAMHRWREALAEAERLGARPEAARTHLEIARRLGPGGASVAGRDPEGHRQLALAGFRTLGLHPGELPPEWRGESATPD
jgi:class 3 adenylate cyclase/tetratricopeptide (TPR) repeat protein